MHAASKTLALATALAAVLCAGQPGVRAENRAAFTLTPIVIGEWLDAQGGGNGPNAFIQWAETHLTQDQIGSLEMLIKSSLMADDRRKVHLESALAALLKAGLDDDAPEVAAIRARRKALDTTTP